MSIKIILISSNDNLFQEFENVYETQIKSGFLKFYSPKFIEQNFNKDMIYDLIITEEKFLSVIPFKKLPIIVLGKKKDIFDKNYLYIDLPIDWAYLYDTIINLQYTNNNLSQEIYISSPPIIENIISNNKSKISSFSKEKEKENYEDSSSMLTTKINNKEDFYKINKIINDYGKKNFIDEKIIAQATIILDELIYTLENSLDVIFDNSLISDTKILINLQSKENEFSLNFECRIPLEKGIKNILSIAEDYAQTIQSFKRNNNSVICLSWYF